jgi:hypothetical protein
MDSQTNNDNILKKQVKRFGRKPYRFCKKILKNYQTKIYLFKLKRSIKPQIGHQNNDSKIRKLKFEKIETLQETINSLNYPSTHEYNLEKLEPEGDLKSRLGQIQVISPNFFHGENLLDIGCNKGFFSLQASQYCNFVEGIDIDKNYTDLCNSLKQPNMKISNTTFRDYVPDKQFDRILIGNVHHYLFRECEGWDWIYKLAAIATDQVIIEGPIDMKCEDLLENKAFSEDLQKKFTYNDFIKIMSKFFVLEEKIDSILPQRYVMRFKRKHDDFNDKIQVIDLPMKTTAKKNDENTAVFVTEYKGKKVLAKILKKSWQKWRPNRENVNIARLSPISNGAIGSIYKNDEFIGWLEELSEDECYGYKENQKELFTLLCNHNIFLSKLGYIETDCSTINFFKTNVFFDKSGVIPIKEINEDVFEKYKNYKTGFFFIHLSLSFDIIDHDMQKLLYDALKSKDSMKIEQSFITIKNLLS